MNKPTIATEKERILEEWETKYSHNRIHSFSNDVHVADVINHLSHSLDHIAAVAKQEGRDEAIEEISKEVNKAGTISFKGTNEFFINRDHLEKYLAKLTGKEEKCLMHGTHEKKEKTY